jgi:hypothetical protein
MGTQRAHKDGGTDNVQIATYIERHLPTQNFVGVFSSDQLPPFEKLPFDACLVSNYSPHDDAGTHWVTMIHLNNHTRPPEYFDSFGFPPDGLDMILNVKSRMTRYLQMCSAKAGFNGRFMHSKLNLQCSQDDVCGEFACFCVIKQCLPQDPVTGKLRPEWNRIPLDWDCRKVDSFVKKFIAIRK